MKGLLLLWFCAPAPAALFGPSPSLEASRSHFEAGRYDQAVSVLETAGLERLRGSDQRRAFLIIGQSYERLGRHDKALGLYQLGARLHPKDINILSELGRLLHRTGLDLEAEPVFQRVLKIHPNNAAAHLGLAEIDFSLGFIDRSAAHYAAALESLSGHSPDWRNYAEVLLAAGSTAEAELAARRSLTLSEDSGTRLVLARIQRASGRLPEALETLAALSSPEAALARALWLLEANRADEALAAADALLKASEPPPLAHMIRARAFLKKGKRQPAVDSLRLAAASGRSAPFTAATAKELLEHLGEHP